MTATTIKVSVKDATGATATMPVVVVNIIPPPPSSGFPDASNTGVPPGTTLTPVGGDFTTSSNGQVVNALDVSGTIFAVNDNVTVKNCRIGQVIASGANFIIQDCTIIGIGLVADNSGITIASPLELGTGPAGPPAADGATIIRCNISGCENLVWLETSHSLVQDNYFHDPLGVPTAHIDGIQVPQDPVEKTDNTIKHNNFDMNLGTVSSCCQFDCVTNFIIINNKYHGGSFELYLLSRNGGTTSGCQVLNNTFVTATIGGLVDEQTATGLNTYTGNVDEFGNPLTLP